MSDRLAFLIFFFIAPAIVLLIIFIPKIIRKKRIEFLEQHSLIIRYLKSINERYNFIDIADYQIINEYDNIKFYDLVSCEDFLISTFLTSKNDYLNNMQNCTFNKMENNKYLDEVRKLQYFGAYDVTINPSKKERYDILEKEYFNELLIDPSIDFKVEVILKCYRMNGELITKKNKVFDSNEVYELIQRFNSHTGYFYKYPEIWEALCRVERGKVTNRLRFAVYARDNYRCKCCGKQFDTNQLEIDHIYPISKGGKSTYSNLQTLCHDCNVNKGTKYIRY